VLTKQHGTVRLVGAQAMPSLNNQTSLTYPSPILRFFVQSLKKQANCARSRHMLGLPSRFFLLPSPSLAFSLFACTTITALLRPPAHELFVSAVSWSLIWIYAVLRCRNGHIDERERGGGGDGLIRRLSWAAGGFLLLGNICEKAAGGGTTSWWTKVC
jgi:hypothetical protein